ncbi:MAG: diguanylate cyclase, partial [Candidatus Altiarchaeota archaeon]|nr:diguanylate cyclase [Candidatus Altiarchaeota archaeon]
VDASRFRVEDLNVEAKRALLVDDMERRWTVPVRDFPLPKKGDLISRQDWVSGILMASMPLNAKMRETAAALSRLAKDESVSILVLPKENDFALNRGVVQVQEQSFVSGRHHRNVRIPAGDSVVFTSLISGEERIDESPLESDSVLIGKDSKSVTVLPIVLGESKAQQQVVGAIVITPKGEERVNPSLLVEARFMAQQLGMVIALEREKEIDVITGALNTKAFDARADREIEKQPALGLVIAYGFIDMDNFKYVRNAFGQQVGTDIIRQFVRVAAAPLERLGFMGTTGGDEFSVLMQSVEKGETVAAARRIIASTHDNMFIVKLGSDSKDVVLAEGEEGAKIRRKKTGGTDTITLPKEFGAETLDDGSRIITLPQGTITISMGMALMDELGDTGGLNASDIRGLLKRQAEQYEEIAKLRGRDRLIHADDVKRRRK